MDLSIFADYTFRIVALGTVILGFTAGVLGSFMVVRRESLVGDVISHSAFPGVVIAFMLTGIKSTGVLIIGALIFGMLASFMIRFIRKYSKIYFDSVLAIVLSSFFGLGILLLTAVQKFPNANQAGLKKFIYGQTSTLLISDVRNMAIVSMIILLIIFTFWKELKIVSFDPIFASTISVNSDLVQTALSICTALTIIIGLEAVGVVLISALLISPAVAARQWTNEFYKMCILSGIFGAFSCFIGTFLSSSISKLPTGPVIVVISSVITLFSLFVSPMTHKRKREKEIKN